MATILGIEALIAKQLAIKDGINVVDLSEETKIEFKQATAKVYDELKDLFKPGLIKRIQSQ